MKHLIHGYEQDASKLVRMECRIDGDVLTVTVRDDGCGIADIALARRPFYTSKPELERSGMGFSVMEAFMDQVQVESVPGKGTTVTMSKQIRHGD